MLNKKTILILFLLVITIGTLSSASANESAGDILNNASSDEIGINDENINDLSEKEVEITDKNTDEILKSTDSGTFTELQTKINSAKEESEIILENDYIYNSIIDKNTIPTITKSLTINGNGHTIDGAGQSALLRILGNMNVALKNIKFKNGYAYEVIRADYLKNLKIYDCDFVDNNGYFGGALVITGTNYVEMNRTYFSNNIAFVGGGLFLNNTQNIFIFESVFEKNYANFGGAICLMNYNQSYLGGCDFAENIVNQTGGGLYLENGKWSIVDTNNFYKNIAEYGGGISLINIAKFDSYNSIFTQNEALLGGAIKIQSSNNILLGGNKFDNNRASNKFDKSKGARGGAINLYYVSKCEINTCFFISNYADGDGSFGGGVYCEESSFIIIHNSDFAKNSASNFAGALSLVNTPDCIIENTNFTSNNGYYVGAVLMSESDAGFDKCNFIKNKATTNDNPIGGIVSIGGEYGAILLDSIFKENTGPQYYGVRIFYSIKLNIKQSGSTCDDKTIIVTATNSVTGSRIKNLEIEFNFNGKKVKVKTNANGQAICKANLPSKTYATTISCGGVGQYTIASKKVNVVIKKATPKITASKKIFKVKVKTKAYTITLKNSKGKVMKNANAKLTVKGKTYSARTNSKGQATFKITNLKNKGNFQATIKYAATGYYNSVNKKATIVVK